MSISLTSTTASGTSAIRSRYVTVPVTVAVEGVAGSVGLGLAGVLSQATAASTRKVITKTSSAPSPVFIAFGSLLCS